MSVDATLRFFAAHPEIRRRMSASEVFPRIKDATRVEIDGEELYIVKGDALGSEEELFVEAVVRGAAGQGALHRDLFGELEEPERELMLTAFKK